MGCMRVFMTPSCSSAVTWDRRCSGTFVATVILAPGDLEQLVAGKHQLGDHRHQMLERIDVDPDGLDLGDVLLGAGIPGIVLRLDLLSQPAPACFSGRPVVSDGCRSGDRRLGDSLFDRCLVGFAEHAALHHDGRLDVFQHTLLVIGTGRFHEGALQLVERYFTGKQVPLQLLEDESARFRRFIRRRIQRALRTTLARCRLVAKRALRDRHWTSRQARRSDPDPRPRARRRLRSSSATISLIRSSVCRISENGVGGHRMAVAELAHQRFSRMRQRLEARQAEKAAGALDGMDEPEDVPEDRLVVGILFEANQFDIDRIRDARRSRSEIRAKDHP